MRQMQRTQNRPWQQTNVPQYAQSGNTLSNRTRYYDMPNMQNMQNMQTSTMQIPNMMGIQNEMGMQTTQPPMQPIQPIQSTQSMIGQATQMQFQPEAETPKQTQQQTEQTRQFVQEALMRLHEVFPMCNINSLADLAATAEGRLTLEYWRRGVPLEEAYRVAFGAQLQESQAKAARQQALNDANSKRHLTQPMGQAAGSARMSAEDKAIWREFFPNATDAQLLEKWRKMG